MQLIIQSFNFKHLVLNRIVKWFFEVDPSYVKMRTHHNKVIYI